MAGSRWASLFAVFAVSCSLESGPAIAASPEREVVMSRSEQLCSVIVENSVQNARGPDENIARALDYIDLVRREYREAMVTYQDFASGEKFTVTFPGGCGQRGPSWIERAQRSAISLGMRASPPFAPRIVMPPDDGASQSLSRVLAGLNEVGASLEDCSISIDLTASRSAEDDSNLQTAIAASRDIYGVPILFVAQRDNTLYVSFFRQCGEKESMFHAIRAVAERRRSPVQMQRFATVSSNELSSVYGNIM